MLLQASVELLANDHCSCIFLQLPLGVAHRCHLLVLQHPGQRHSPCCSTALGWSQLHLLAQQSARRCLNPGCDASLLPHLVFQGFNNIINLRRIASQLPSLIAGSKQLGPVQPAACAFGRRASCTPSPAPAFDCTVAACEAIMQHSHLYAGLCSLPLCSPDPPPPPSCAGMA